MNNEDRRRKLDKFGELAIKYFKNLPLLDIEAFFKGLSPDVSAQAFQRKLVSLDDDVKELIKACVTYATTSALFYFLDDLQYFYDGNHDISVLVDGDNLVGMSEEGIIFEPMGEEGWEARFSKYPTTNEIYEKYAEIFNRERKE